MSFLGDLTRFQVKTERNIAKVVNTVVSEVAESLVELSPWGDWDAWSDESKSHRPRPPYSPGAFRGSWDYAKSTLPITEFGELDPRGDKLRSLVRASFGYSLEDVAVDHIFLSKAPYADKMENASYLVGHNIELGLMVETTGQNFYGIVKEAVRHVRG